jgi:hypothetical protein
VADYTELKRLAEAAQEDPNSPYLPCPVAFMNAATPGVVLSLIAENEELGRYLCTCRDCGGEGSLHTGDWHSYSHMEPPEPVMEKCGECDGTGLLGEIQDLYQVITERDQLKAESAGLQTGYKAYEQVNAELRAEVERLNNALSVTDAAAQKWLEERAALQSAAAEARELFCSILDNPRLVLGMPSALLVGVKDFIFSQPARAAMGQGEQP